MKVPGKTVGSLGVIAIVLGVLAVLTGLALAQQGGGKTEGAQEKQEIQQARDPRLEEARKLNDQAKSMYAAGRYAEALRLVRKTLSLREEALGPEHPDVADSLNNLAGLLSAQGDYAAARPLIERALKIQNAECGWRIYQSAIRHDQPSLIHGLGKGARYW